MTAVIQAVAPSDAPISNNDKKRAQTLVEGVLEMSAAPENTPYVRLANLRSAYKAAMRMRIRVDNAVGGFVRRVIGWQMDLSEEDRKRLKRIAKLIVEAIVKDAAAPAGYEKYMEIARAFVEGSTAANAPFEAMEAKLAKDMIAIVKTLPIYERIKEFRGLGALSLALIIGGAGDLAKYPNPAKAWKRFGLAPKECYRRECKRGGVKFTRVNEETGEVEELRSALCVPRERRSDMWVVGDNLIRAHSPYAAIYRARKEYELPRIPEKRSKPDKNGKVKILSPKMHAHRRAHRYMEKRFLKDLWCVWNGKPFTPPQALTSAEMEAIVKDVDSANVE